MKTTFVTIASNRHRKLGVGITVQHTVTHHDLCKEEQTSLACSSAFYLASCCLLTTVSSAVHRLSFYSANRQLAINEVHLCIVASMESVCVCMCV